MKLPNLFLLLSLISFLSIILITGSTLKSYTNFYENNNHILLKLPTIFPQENSGDFEDDGIFPDFKTEDKGDKEDDGIFPDFKTEDKGDKGKDGGGDGDKGKDGGGDGDKGKDGGGDGDKEKGKEKMEVVMEIKEKMEEMKEELTKILMILAPYPLVRQQIKLIK